MKWWNCVQYSELNWNCDQHPGFYILGPCKCVEDYYEDDVDPVVKALVSMLGPGKLIEDDVNKVLKFQGSIFGPGAEP